MSAPARYVGLAGAAVGVLAAGTAAVLVAGRRRESSAPDDGTAPLGSLHGEDQPLCTADGVQLHVEVDPGPTDDPAVVFVHGFGLTSDSWHYQRQALRGRALLVLFDQRGHGRSGRSPRAAYTIDRLGTDLREVVDATVPHQQILLVGHSMGGMALLAGAYQSPEWFSERVAGVVLVSTCADGMGDVTFGLPRGVARLLHDTSPAVLETLARAPRLVEHGRRIGAPYTLALTRRFGFGGPISPELAAFTDRMLTSTPVDVIASFYPEFARLDKAHVLVGGCWPPTTIICGDRDLLTPVEMSRRMASALPTARLVEVPAGGHLVMLEHPGIVTAEIERLLDEVAQ